MKTSWVLAVAVALGTNSILINGGSLIIAATNAYVGTNGIPVVPAGGTLVTLVLEALGDVARRRVPLRSRRGTRRWPLGGFSSLDCLNIRIFSWRP